MGGRTRDTQKEIKDERKEKIMRAERKEVTNKRRQEGIL
jgi:hypothetical protein